MIAATKKVWRKVKCDRGEFAIAITPDGVLIRQKGTRSTFSVPTGAVFDVAVKLDAMSRGIPVPQRRNRGGAR